MPISVDVVILSRTIADVRPNLKAAVRCQSGVQTQIFRVIGNPHEADEHRWHTIARARNHGRILGSSPWILFLDDDVIPASNCLQQLVAELQNDASLGAVAADYNLAASGTGFDEHVGMGATLFRREALQQIEFRSEPGVCECGCCVRDLRSRGWQVRYSTVAQAEHLNPKHQRQRPAALMSGGNSPATQGTIAGRVLAAFDRRHLRKFCTLFLPTLRRSGNREIVSVIGYGLFPSERRRMNRLHGVECRFLPGNGMMTPKRRLRDFQPLLASLPAETPGAYWDAGDVVFQSRLQPLWNIVARHPHRLLACAEPKWYPANPAVAGWTLGIRDPQTRGRAFRLLSRNPFLNSGFAAGTAETLLSYFREADRLLHSKELFGSGDWGDQTALNLYCHSDPQRWLRIADGWNYCIHDRRQEITVQSDGTILSRRHEPIYVAHGNAKSLRQFEISASCFS